MGREAAAEAAAERRQPVEWVLGPSQSIGKRLTETDRVQRLPPSQRGWVGHSGPAENSQLESTTVTLPSKTFFSTTSVTVVDPEHDDDAGCGRIAISIDFVQAQ